ncbi:hypothetical protein E3P78_00785 [Wallemia ichthyophaga]|nr:hypothetical protein E3P78_00785 [Wallemia ichthyophaga]
MSVLDYADRIIYSDRYSDDFFEYRHVILPKQVLRLLPRQYFEADDSGVLRILTEAEWRGMGITQSLGWEMYATHAPEPHILLFRREKDYQGKYGIEGKPLHTRKKSINSAVLTPRGFILLAASDTLFCLPLKSIGQPPRVLIKRLKSAHSISILPLTSVILISTDNATRYYDLRQVEKSCLQLWDMSTGQVNVLPDLRTPAPPALQDGELNHLTHLPPPTPTSPPFSISPSMPDISASTNSPALPPLPFQIEENSSLFGGADVGADSAATSPAPSPAISAAPSPFHPSIQTTPIHQRRKARQPPTLNTVNTPHAQSTQPHVDGHARSRSEDLTPLTSDVVKRELERVHIRNNRSKKSAAKLTHKNLNDIIHPTILRVGETSELSYLAVLSLTLPDNDTRQPADQTTVSLFAGTQHAPLSLVKAFILPDRPVDLQLSIKGDDMSEIILVYDRSIFALNPFSINVREIKVGRGGRRRRNQNGHSNGERDGETQGGGAHGDSTRWSTELANQGGVQDTRVVDMGVGVGETAPTPVSMSVHGGQNDPISTEHSSNSLASTILANNSYTNFTPPLIETNGANLSNTTHPTNSNSTHSTPTRRTSSRFGGLSRWTSMLQRPFQPRTSSNVLGSQSQSDTVQEDATTPTVSPETRKTTINPHYTTLVQLHQTPPLPPAALEKMFTIPPRYDELEAQRSRSVFMNKTASQLSARSHHQDDLRKCWHYLDPRGTEHGPWSTKTMQNWYTSRRFLSNLPIRHERMRYHKTLTELIAQFGAENPFVVALGAVLQYSPADSLKSLDPPTPLLPPISLISDPALPRTGAQSIYLAARRYLPTMLIDHNGRSIVRGSGIRWVGSGYSDGGEHTDAETNSDDDIKHFEMISTSDDNTTAALVAIRQRSFEVIDIADALLGHPSEREKALPGWERHMCRAGVSRPYVHKLHKHRRDRRDLNAETARGRSYSHPRYVNNGLQLPSESHSRAHLPHSNSNSDGDAVRLIYIGRQAQAHSETVYLLESYSDGNVRIARVRGLVTRVGDGDNFRLYHTPLLSFTQRRAILGRKMTANDTIHVRLAGVDAPETAHFGKPAQPYANEALEWLRKTITGEKVSVKLLRKDRYGRVVGNAQLLAKWYRPWRKNVSMELTKGKLLHWRRDTVSLPNAAGYGSIYAQDGAEYDGMLDRLRKVESDARRKKRGMWKQKKVELPADYKSKYRG